MTNNNGQDQRHRDHSASGLGSSKKESRGVGDESDKVVNLNRQRTNIDDPGRIRRRRELIGGILSQLIEDAKDQLAEYERQLKECEQRMSYYRTQIKKVNKRIDSLEKLNISSGEGANNSSESIG